MGYLYLLYQMHVSPLPLLIIRRCFSSFVFGEEHLPVFQSHLKELPLRKLRSPTDKRAAVFVPLCNVDGEPSLLFTKRSDNMRKHSGQVSFPGGLIRCAIRETEEELGLAPNRFDNQLIPLGPYHETLSSSSITVTPIIGYIKHFNIETMSPNEEVDTIFTLRITDLLDPLKQSSKSIQVPGLLHPSRMQQKVYTAGQWPVWGLTSYITEHILREVVQLHEKQVI